ncbi:MAG: hypothetical protein ACLT2C_01025 [Ruminococcus sp.]
MGKMYRYPHDYCPYCYHKIETYSFYCPKCVAQHPETAVTQPDKNIPLDYRGFPCAATAAVSCESAAPTMPAGIKTTSFRRNPLLW